MKLSILNFQDVDSFLSAGKKGSVLFSMGTNIHSKNLGLDKQKAILEVFSQLPEYNFLWKFEDKDFPLPLPSNVLIKPWTSQNDVLNHSNVRLFVSHGGALSTYEATWHGVPVLGIPFIVDQHRVIINNLKKLIIIFLCNRYFIVVYYFQNRTFSNQ